LRQSQNRKSLVPMTQTKGLAAMVLFSLALTPMVSACGGSSGSCGKVQPCGGDVVGNWRISGACLDSAALSMDIGMACPGATINISLVNVSGSASFNADLTYTVTQSASFTAQETIPASCLTSGGLTLTCAQLDQQLQQQIAMDPSTFQSARCSGSSSCTCTFTIAPQTSTDTGTYTTSGTTLSITSSDGSTSSNGYCVQGNEFHIVQFDMTMPMGKIQADTVLTK
jgi:hypothetical protein